MGREVRIVPANWQHPKYSASSAPYPNSVGRYIPLEKGGYTERAREWDEEWAKWQEGFCRSYGTDQRWEPIAPEDAGTRYTDYAGPRPSPDGYMPDWPESERTHFMMYEDTSEGTPISPAFATAEELAKWLADTGASAFADMTATYEQWLSTIKAGWAPSMIIEAGKGMRSGVAAV